MGSGTRSGPGIGGSGLGGTGVSLRMSVSCPPCARRKLRPEPGRPTPALRASATRTHAGGRRGTRRARPGRPQTRVTTHTATAEGTEAAPPPAAPILLPAHNRGSFSSASLTPAAFRKTEWNDILPAPFAWGDTPTGEGAQRGGGRAPEAHRSAATSVPALTNRGMDRWYSTARGAQS
jgi:hypothetical protein